MDGSIGYYAKWNKSVGERQIPLSFTYIWNLKNKKQMNKHNKTEMNQRLREQTGSCQRGGEKNGRMSEICVGD